MTENYTISTDVNLMDIKFIHNFLCYESSWAKGISYQTVEQSIKNSLCFALLNKPETYMEIYHPTLYQH